MRFALHTTPCASRFIPACPQVPRPQMRELQAVAERHGWQVVATFTDEGISSVKGRDQCPA
jgi:hypothetical protein